MIHIKARCFAQLRWVGTGNLHGDWRGFISVIHAMHGFTGLPKLRVRNSHF